jgi:hypothetical protein
MTPRYVSRVMRITLLAPDVVEAILDGRQPDGVTLPALMEPFPVSWPEQRKALAGSRAARRKGALLSEEGGN